MRLRSVDLAVTDVDAAAAFLEKPWGLVPVQHPGATRFFRGSGDHPYVLSVTPAAAPSILSITLAGTAAELAAVRGRAQVEQTTLDLPGGGAGFAVRGPEGQVYRLVEEAARPAPLPATRERPIQVTHAVINTADREACERFAVDVLGFRVSDRTGHMTFVRCDRKHHSIAFAQSKGASLNHIAFEMQDLEAVMLGIGRMKDAGYDAVWGPGRHGPGNNVFGYFVAPFGGIVEYTSEVEEVGDDYPVGTPEKWKWPAGRIDHWGVSKKDISKTGPAEQVFRFK